MKEKMKSLNLLVATLFAVGMAVSDMTSHAQATAPAAAQPAAPADAPAVKPTTPSSPPLTRLAVTELAKKIYLQLASGTVDRSLLTPEESKALSPETIAKLAPQLKAFGAPVDFKIIGASRINGGLNYKFAVRFSDQQHQVAMYVDPHGLVGGYSIRP